MTDNIMTNEEFYRDTATVAMAAYNESGITTADKTVSDLVAARFEDSAEREFAATEIAKHIAKDFEDMVDANMAKEITEQEELPLEEAPTTEADADVAE